MTVLVLFCLVLARAALLLVLRMQRLGVPNDLIDRCQNHVLGGPAVRRHYLLYDFADEKRAAWEKLGARFDQLLKLTAG